MEKIINGRKRRIIREFEINNIKVFLCNYPAYAGGNVCKAFVEDYNGNKYRCEWNIISREDKFTYNCNWNNPIIFEKC